MRELTAPIIIALLILWAATAVYAGIVRSELSGCQRATEQRFRRDAEIRDSLMMVLTEQRKRTAEYTRLWLRAAAFSDSLYERLGVAETKERDARRRLKYATSGELKDIILWRNEHQYPGPGN